MNTTTNKTPIENKIHFTSYDMALLYNSKLLVDTLCNIVKEDYKKDNDAIKEIVLDTINNLPNSIKEAIDTTSLDVAKEVKYGDVTYGLSYGKKDKEDIIFYGYFLELYKKKMEEELKGKECSFNLEDYLYGMCINTKLLDNSVLDELSKEKKKINNILIDEGYLYIPLQNLNAKNSNICGITKKEEEEYTLDVLNSILCLYKMQNLIKSSIDKFLQGLNKESSHTFTKGKANYKDDIFLGYYITIDEAYNDYIYFGMNPEVFTQCEKGVIAHDYFIAIKIALLAYLFVFDKDLCAQHRKFKKIKWAPNGKAMGTDSLIARAYYPICRKTLATRNVVESFTNKALSVIKEAINLDTMHILYED